MPWVADALPEAWPFAHHMDVLRPGEACPRRHKMSEMLTALTPPLDGAVSCSSNVFKYAPA